MNISKFFVMPLADFLTALATLYLFKLLSDKNKLLQKEKKRPLIKKHFNDLGTEDLNDILRVKEMDPGAPAEEEEDEDDSEPPEPLKVRGGGAA